MKSLSAQYGLVRISVCETPSRPDPMKPVGCDVEVRSGAAYYAAGLVKRSP
jgi:hypothetical protein